ncbi:MAG: acyl-CoA dehydrogenase family protein [Microthrixaceae bacterium]
MSASTDAARQTNPSEDVSFAARLFCGELHAEAVWPYPRMDPEERVRVEAIESDFLDYCADHYDPAKVEAERWVSDETLADLAELGMLGLYVPTEYGGQGLSQTGYARVFQAVGQVDPTLAVVLGVHQSIGYKGIHLFGTDQQKERFLPRLASGELLAGFALTEKNAGSDAYHVETVATPQSDGSFLVSGDKRYIGNGSRAGVLTTFARTPEGEHVALLVESDADGFEVGERYETLGLAGNDLRKLHLRDVRVPRENLLGEVGDGFNIGMEILNNGRMSLGTGAAGSVRLLIDQALEHAGSRRQFGRPLAEFQLVAHKLGQMSTQLYGLESMGYLTTGMVDRGVTDVSLESAMVKIAGTEFLWYAVNRVFQIVGGEAYMTGAPYEKVLRDIRIFPIFEGANDVMRMFVAMKGCQELGDELEGLANFDLTDPLRGVGAVVGYLGGRLGRAVNPPGLPDAAAPFADASDRVARQVRSLRETTESLVRAHGTGVTERQADLKRLTQATMDIYGQVATISRISDVLDDATTSSVLGEEEAIASSFCERAASRAERSLAQVDDNDDEAIDLIATNLIDRGAYRHTV